MRTTELLLSLLALAGCASGPALGPNERRTDAPTALKPAPDRGIGWGSFELPKDAACALESRKGWQAHDDAEVPIYLGPGDTPVAVVRAYARRGVLLFPEGPRPGRQPVELEDEGVVVRGMIDAEASELRSERFVSFGRYLAPLRFTRFHWRAAKPGELELELGPLTRFVPAEPLALRARCEDVAIGESTGSWTPRDLPTSVGIAAYGEKLVRVRPDSEVTLFDAPKGGALGRFSAGEPIPVYEIERRPGWVRVLFEGYVEITGWLREADTVPFEAQGSLREVKRPGPEPLRMRPHAAYRCREDVHFGIALREAGTFFGLFRTGTPFGVDPATRGEDVVLVRPLGGTIREGREVRWFARSADLSGCEEIPAGE